MPGGLSSRKRNTIPEESPIPEYKTANKFRTINRNDVETWLSTKSENWVKALMIFLYLYGVRIGEALQIKREDLYIQEDYLFLITPVSTLEKNPDPYPRRLPISVRSPGAPYLLAYLEALDPDDLLFPYSRSYSWKMIHRIDPELSPHVFRHNRATEFSLQDATDSELQAWLGHSDPRQASTYRHRSGVLSEKLGKRSTIL